MKKPLELNQQQAAEFAKRMNDELGKVIMSWDNELRSWYPTALHSLTFTSAVTAQVPQELFINLFSQEKQGLNMNVVMILSNSVEQRTPFEMNMSAYDWAKFLLVNSAVAARWNILKQPVHDKVYQEFLIMANRPKSLVLT